MFLVYACHTTIMKAPPSLLILKADTVLAYTEDAHIKAECLVGASYVILRVSWKITSKGQSTCNWPCIYIAYFRVSLWHQHNPGYKSLSGLWNALHLQLWTQKLSRPTHTLLFWNISTMISSKGNNGIKFWPKLIFPVRFTMLNILRSQPQKQNQTPQN